MKNLFGAAAPTNRFLGSFKVLMLVVLVAIGFTSCKDQSKSKVSTETELIAKSKFQNSEDRFDIGGQGTPRKFCDIGGNGGQERRNFDIGGIGGGQTPPRRICEMYSTKEIGGGKSSDGGLGMLNTLSPGTARIGGKSTGGGEYSTCDIGGRGSTDTSTGQFTLCEIGGRDSGGGSGNYNMPSFNTVEIDGKSTGGGDYSTSDIGGRGGIDPPGGIDSRFHGNDKNKDYEPY
jgi:hypothetical protein